MYPAMGVALYRRGVMDNFVLVHAFVASRIDYCCSLLFGSPKTDSDKLQRVLNECTCCHEYEGYIMQ